MGCEEIYNCPSCSEASRVRVAELQASLSAAEMANDRFREVLQYISFCGDTGIFPHCAGCLLLVKSTLYAEGEGKPKDAV